MAREENGKATKKVKRPRTGNRLTVLKVRSVIATAKRTGKRRMIADGHGLWLAADATRANWLFRFQINHVPRAMGLGIISTFSLQDAREKALAARKLVHAGIDPIKDRDAARTKAIIEAASEKTFGQCCTEYVAAHSAEWTPKEADNWTMTLETHAAPLNALPVAQIDTALILKTLQPMWGVNTTTAARLRGRIENVLDGAKAAGYRTGENPARWRGHLAKLLGKPSKLHKVKHHAEMACADLPAFMVKLRKQESVVARALEFLILTAARTAEARDATWGEFDLDAGLWTIPASRMKAGGEHVVPLSPRCLEILGPKGEPGERVFPSINVNTMLYLLRRMTRSRLTGHGFRTTFSDWASETTNAASAVIEKSLAHAIGTDVEATYKRGQLIAKRRKLMMQWERHCASAETAVNVVRLDQARSLAHGRAVV